jgi:glutaredoxin
MENKPKIVAYLKEHCGWSGGVRAIMDKYHLEYEEKEITMNSNNYQEMVQKSGQELSPCVEVDGHMLKDVDGDEVESYLVEKQIVRKSEEATAVPTNESCQDHDAPNASFGHQ